MLLAWGPPFLRPWPPARFARWKKRRMRFVPNFEWLNRMRSPLKRTKSFTPCIAIYTLGSAAPARPRFPQAASFRHCVAWPRRREVTHDPESPARRSAGSKSGVSASRACAIHLWQREWNRTRRGLGGDQAERRSLRQDETRGPGGHGSARPGYRGLAAPILRSGHACDSVSRVRFHRGRRAHTFASRHVLGPGATRNSVLRHHARRLFPRPHSSDQTAYAGADSRGLRGEHRPRHRSTIRKLGSDASAGRARRRTRTLLLGRHAHRSSAC